MPLLAWLLLVAAAVLLVWVALTFNAFIRLRNRVREAFSGVDVQLRRRHDLVPNLVKVVQAYASHERTTLEEVTEARGAAAGARAVAERELSENGLSRSLDRLIALVEAYPDLKADGNFLKLHGDLVEIEEHIQYARRYYNGAVRDFNNRIQNGSDPSLTAGRTVFVQTWFRDPGDSFGFADGLSNALKFTILP